MLQSQTHQMHMHPAVYIAVLVKDCSKSKCLSVIKAIGVISTMPKNYQLSSKLTY